MTPKLYKLIIPMRRSSDLTEIAVVDDEQWNQFKAHAGVELYFGEVAGKHSEVTWELDMAALEVLSESHDEIALFRKWFPRGGVGQVSVAEALWGWHEQNLRTGETCKCGFKFDA